MAENKELTQETKELLRSYFAAFANLYGITPLCRALRIIQSHGKQVC